MSIEVEVKRSLSFQYRQSTNQQQKQAALVSPEPKTTAEKCPVETQPATIKADIPPTGHRLF